MSVTPPERRTQAERRAATRAALVVAARALFAEHGYAGVATEQIVAAAGVTRGALYHHFKGGKPELLEAAYIALEEDVMARIAQTVEQHDDMWTGLLAGIDAFLADATRESEVQQIALIDAPSVLGWERWREIGETAALGLIEAAVTALIAAGTIADRPPRPLAHVLLGAIDEGAMYVARAEDPEAARVEVRESLDALLTGLRIDR